MAFLSISPKPRPARQRNAWNCQIQNQIQEWSCFAQNEIEKSGSDIWRLLDLRLETVKKICSSALCDVTRSTFWLLSIPKLFCDTIVFIMIHVYIPNSQKIATDFRPGIHTLHKWRQEFTHKELYWSQETKIGADLGQAWYQRPSARGGH